MSLMKLADEKANLSSHDSFEWLAFRCNDIYRDPARTQRGGNFQTDKAGTNNHYTPR